MRAREAESLFARCLTARPRHTNRMAWTESAVALARAMAIELGVRETDAEVVLLALAADDEVETPHAVRNRDLFKRARARARTESMVLGAVEWCGLCDPGGQHNPSARFRDYRTDHPTACYECHPSCAA